MFGKGFRVQEPTELQSLLSEPSASRAVAFKIHEPGSGTATTVIVSSRSISALPSLISPGVSDQFGLQSPSIPISIGHADPAFTLRVSAHALRKEKTDLSFADFGGSRWQWPNLRTAPNKTPPV